MNVPVAVSLPGARRPRGTRSAGFEHRCTRALNEPIATLSQFRHHRPHAEYANDNDLYVGQ